MPGLEDPERALRIDNGEGVSFLLTYYWPCRHAQALGDYPRVAGRTFDPHTAGALPYDARVIAADLIRRFIPRYLILHTACVAAADHYRRSLEATRRETESLLQRGPFKRGDVDMSTPACPALRLYNSVDGPYGQFHVRWGRWQIELHDVPPALVSRLAFEIREFLEDSSNATD